MEDRSFLQRLDPRLILTILLDARAGVRPNQPGISNTSTIPNHRRYIILLAEYGLVTTEPCDSEVGGCYPCIVRLTGITAEGEQYLEGLQPVQAGTIETNSRENSKMIMTTTLSDLLQSRILLTSGDNRSQLRALACGTTTNRRAMVTMLEDLGFGHVGASPYWNLQLTEEQMRKRSCQDIFDLLVPNTTWFLGKVFVNDGESPSIDLSGVPSLWRGTCALQVRESEHCLQFDRDASSVDLCSRYKLEYADYMNNEFHPAE